MKSKNTAITLHLSQEQYVQVKSKAEETGVSVEGYALYKVIHEDKTTIAPIDKLLITPAEACKLLGIGRTVMYRLIKEGAVPAVKLPGCRRIYISVEGLRAMIHAHTVAPSEIGGDLDE